jgi:transcriptional regulator with XRE-family HTH domain
MESLATTFGRRLRTLRESEGLTQEQLGRSAGVDYKHIGAIERGEKVPSFDAVESIAKALRVDYYELFLPDELSVGKHEQGLKIAVRDIEKHGTPELRQFLQQVLSAARALTQAH